MTLPVARSPSRPFQAALWAALLVQAGASVWRGDGPAATLATAGLVLGALLLFALAATTVVGRRGVTVLGAWSLWVVLVGATAQLVAVAWSLLARTPLHVAAGAGDFHLIGMLIALLGLGGLRLVDLRFARIGAARPGAA